MQSSYAGHARVLVGSVPNSGCHTSLLRKKTKQSRSQQSQGWNQMSFKDPFKT